MDMPFETPDEDRSEERDAALINAVRQSGELYIVMDLGGTKAYVAVMTRDAEGLYYKRHDTESHDDAEELLRFIRGWLWEPIDRICELTGMGRKDVQQRIKAIGIAFPGPTDFEKGTVLDASNFEIKNFNLARKVESTFEIETLVDNDVNLGVVGEAWKGAANGYKNIVGIMIGTGIGGGIIINGQVYRGRNKTAGEVGHMILDLDSKIKCGCGQVGCFEALASRKSMARDLHNRKWNQGVRYRMWAERNLLSNQIASYYKEGDADAVAVVHRAAEICGKAVFSILNLFNPEIIVFNGGFVQQLGEAFLEPVREEAKKCMNAVYSLADNKIPIALGQLRNPVLIGACRMAIEGKARKPSRSIKQVLESIVEQLDEDDRELLTELYHVERPVAFTGHSKADYTEEKLRNLRNLGLVRTESGLSFRNSDRVEITDFGRYVTEEVLWPEI